MAGDAENVAVYGRRGKIADPGCSAEGERPQGLFARKYVRFGRPLPEGRKINKKSSYQLLRSPKIEEGFEFVIFEMLMISGVFREREKCSTHSI